MGIILQVSNRWCYLREIAYLTQHLVYLMPNANLFSAHYSVLMMSLGDVKAAIDAAVFTNQWDKAVELAEQHNFPQIEGAIMKNICTVYGSLV